MSIAIRFLTDSVFRRSIIRRYFFDLFGYDYTHWLRSAQINDWLVFLNGLNHQSMTALEISPEKRTTWRDVGFKAYTATNYPEFDISAMKTEESFDIIIADNVFEHVSDPWSAGRNVYAMLNDMGHFVIAMPFMIKVHGDDDYWRFTENGMRRFLRDVGFADENIVTKSWGNRSCARDAFRHWGKVGFGFYRDFKNQPDVPTTVWAYARK